ncbi:Protein of unknown function [Cotesia congregata]|uniref:Uncharacterized protein n=1 Tax=Cotesia congregata TaxID=51543 RepID=A0A8J2MTV6_COTCN|nr:Protein of unknown function [Cotesia congregata]
MNEALNDQYLAIKVVLIFGICGCMRCKELTEMKVEDIKDLNERYLNETAIDTQPQPSTSKEGTINPQTVTTIPQQKNQ